MKRSTFYRKRKKLIANLPRLAAHHIQNGIKYGYPTCCIYQFANDEFIEEDDATIYATIDGGKELYRVVPFGLVRGGNGYVKCWDCSESGLFPRGRGVRSAESGCSRGWV